MTHIAALGGGGGHSGTLSSSYDDLRSRPRQGCTD